MSYEFVPLLQRTAGSIELATIIAATAVVMLAIIRQASLGQLKQHPERELDILRSYYFGRRLVVFAAAITIAGAFSFDVRGQLFGTPSAGFRISSVAFLFVIWAATLTVLLRARPEVAQPAPDGRRARRSNDEPHSPQQGTE
jgi:hypothetical protein